MPRKSRIETERSRQKIIASAAKLFRTKGYAETSLDDVTKDAGLTVGAFYTHFRSKAALFTEALGEAATDAHEILMRGQSDSKNWAELFVQNYLSERHRASTARGCPVPSLISELSRTDLESRQALEEFLKNLLRHRSKYFGKSRAQQKLLATFCLAVGTIAVSRAVPSKNFAKQILKASREVALKGLK